MAKLDLKPTMGVDVWLRAVVLMLLLAGIVVLNRFVDLSHAFAHDQVNATAESIRSWVHPFGVLGPLVFVACGSVALAANVPSVILIYAAVVTFGTVPGCLLAFCVIAGGLSCVYVLGQRLGRPFVQRLFGQRLAALEARLTRRELVNVITLRLVFFMNPALNWLLSISDVRYRTLIVGSLIGVAHNVLILIWLGSAVGELLQAGRSLNPLQTPELMLPVGVGILVFVVVHAVDRRVSRRRQGDGPPLCESVHLNDKRKEA